jgi:hypothetical protein
MDEIEKAGDNLPSDNAAKLLTDMIEIQLADDNQ